MSDPRGNAIDAGLFEDDDSDLADRHEFEEALAAGTEALQRNDPAEARASLDKALRYKPRNQRARNLLGLSLFKLGELDRAEEIYRSLIEDHPADPTLRVNLGLVFLKTGASSDAVRCFETALDLAPEHRKAQNYLGLALAQRGEAAQAREWFLKAGNGPMAERMAQTIATSPLRQVAQDAEESLSAAAPFRSALEEANGAEATTAGGATSWLATSPRSPAAPPAELPIAHLPAPSMPAPPPGEEPPGNVGAGSVELEIPASALADYTSQQRLKMPEAGSGFAIGPNEVLLHVRGEILTRLDGLVASWGSVKMTPELKRFRGKATDKPFGDGPRRMLRASGEGRLVISRENRNFTVLELGDEPAYFREEILFAFEESILFENGRVPSRTGADLHLVHLRGHGRLLLVTAGPPRSVEVRRGEPLRIPMEQLVGWHGPLIQPRLVPIVEEAPDLGVALELSGDGRALVDAPAGR